MFILCLPLEKFGFFPVYFAKQQVGQTTRSQSEPLIGEPLFAEYFFHDGVVNDGIHYGVDAASGFKTNLNARKPLRV